MSSCVYDSLGKVCWSIEGPMEDLGGIEDDLFKAEFDQDISPNEHWIDIAAGNLLKDKTDFPQMSSGYERVNNFYEITITGIPLGTTVIWPDGESTLEDDGEVIVEVRFTGNYYFSFWNARHHNTSIEVVI